MITKTFFLLSRLHRISCIELDVSQAFPVLVREGAAKPLSAGKADLELGPQEGNTTLEGEKGIPLAATRPPRIAISFRLCAVVRLESLHSSRERGVAPVMMLTKMPVPAAPQSPKRPQNPPIICSARFRGSLSPSPSARGLPCLVVICRKEHGRDQEMKFWSMHLYGRIFHEGYRHFERIHLRAPDAGELDNILAAEAVAPFADVMSPFAPRGGGKSSPQYMQRISSGSSRYSRSPPQIRQPDWWVISYVVGEVGDKGLGKRLEMFFQKYLIITCMSQYIQDLELSVFNFNEQYISDNLKKLRNFDLNY